MAIHKHSSWGRTRRPKHLSENVPSSKQTATTVTTVAVGDLSDALTSTSAGANGYSTENQKFLHVQIENNDAAETLTIYAYNYAFGGWAPLYLPLSFDRGDSEHTSDDDSGDSDETVAAAVAAGTVNDAYAIATFNSVNGKYMVVVPIHGIDRVAFVDDGTHDGSFVVRAACSTF
jgi:hypothetical protein